MKTTLIFFSMILWPSLLSGQEYIHVMKSQIDTLYISEGVLKIHIDKDQDLCELRLDEAATLLLTSNNSTLAEFIILPNDLALRPQEPFVQLSESGRVTDDQGILIIRYSHCSESRKREFFNRIKLLEGN